MPFFFTPKPRQFHYDPRFYDPEKEKWEALKQKYNDSKASEQPQDSIAPSDNSTNDVDDELRYFQDKVRRIERQRQQHRLTWKDLFRKRKMPTFNYQPRFQQTTDHQSPTLQDPQSDQTSSTSQNPSAFNNSSLETLAAKYSTSENPHAIRIRRRYNIDDPEYMKPAPASKIMLYGLLTFLLLFWILF